MRDSGDDLEALQDILDRSASQSGDHLRSAFDQSKRLAADRLAAALDGIFELHLAVLSGSGAPLVAPLDGIFFKGRVWIGLPGTSLRARLVRRDPRVSASYNTPEVAFILHGTALEAEPDNPLLPEYSQLMRDLYVAEYGAGWLKWYESQRAKSARGYAGYIEPRVMFAKGHSR